MRCPFLTRARIFFPQWARKQAAAFAPHIHEGDLGQGTAVNALWQGEDVVFSSLRVVMRFEGWGRRSEHNGQVLQAGAHDGDIPGIVPRGRIILFVGSVVFFVNDDQAQVFDRCKNSGPRANDDCAFSRANFAPRIVAFSARQRAVQDRDLVAKVDAKAAHGLRGQRDFRHENKRAFARREGMGNSANIDQCFAAAGHAAQEVNAKSALIDAPIDRVDGVRLMGRGRNVFGRGQIDMGVWVAHDFAVDKADEVAVDQPFEYLRGNPLGGQLRDREGVLCRVQAANTLRLAGGAFFENGQFQIKPARIAGHECGHALGFGFYLWRGHFLKRMRDAAPQQAVHRRVYPTFAKAVLKLAHRRGPEIAQGGDNLALACGKQFDDRTVKVVGNGEMLPAVQMNARRERGGKHFRETAQIIPRHPLTQIEHRRCDEGIGIENLGNGFDPTGREVARFAKSHDNARDPAFAKRDEHAATRLQVRL